MNPVRKGVVVRVFSLDAPLETIQNFCGSFRSLIRLRKGCDIITGRQGRYIVRCIDEKDTSVEGSRLLFWSCVKERNSWQVRSTQDGQIFGLDDANSIVGDISYYKLDPDRNVIAAFSAYSPAGYLKYLCSLVFARLTSESASFSVNYLSDDKRIALVKEWDYYSKISLKISIDNIARTDTLPSLVKALFRLRDAFGGSEISVTIEERDKLSKPNVTEAIDYLIANENCRSLAVSGGKLEGDEKSIGINLKKAFVTYRTNIELKLNQKFIDFQQASSVLSDAHRITEL